MDARRCPRCTFTLVAQPVGGASKVAWWAHIGGFVAGFAWALVLGRRFCDGAELARAPMTDRGNG